MAELDPLGFQLDWSTEQRSLDSVLFILRREIPDLVEIYERWDTLNNAEKEALRQRIYDIGVSHFRGWGLGSALHPRTTYFSRSYITVLQKIFQKAELDTLGFKPDWSTLDRALATIRFSIRRERPDIMRDYDRWDHLGSIERMDLKRRISSLSVVYFKLWGVGHSGYQKTNLFKGSFESTLKTIFPKVFESSDQPSAASDASAPEPSSSHAAGDQKPFVAGLALLFATLAGLLSAAQLSSAQEHKTQNAQPPVLTQNIEGVRVAQIPSAQQSGKNEANPKGQEAAEALAQLQEDFPKIKISIQGKNSEETLDLVRETRKVLEFIKRVAPETLTRDTYWRLGEIRIENGQVLITEVFPSVKLRHDPLRYSLKDLAAAIINTASLTRDNFRLWIEYVVPSKAWKEEERMKLRKFYLGHGEFNALTEEFKEKLSHIEMMAETYMQERAERFFRQAASDYHSGRVSQKDIQTKPEFYFIDTLAKGQPLDEARLKAMSPNLRWPTWIKLTYGTLILMGLITGIYFLRKPIIRFTQRLWPHVRTVINKVIPGTGALALMAGFALASPASGKDVANPHKLSLPASPRGMVTMESHLEKIAVGQILANVRSQPLNLKIEEVLGAPFEKVGHEIKQTDRQIELIEVSDEAHAGKLVEDALNWQRAAPDETRDVIVYIAPTEGSTYDGIAKAILKVLNDQEQNDHTTFIFRDKEKTGYSLESVLEAAHKSQASDYLRLKKNIFPQVSAHLAWMMTTTRWNNPSKGGIHIGNLVIPFQDIVPYLLNLASGEATLIDLNTQLKGSQLTQKAA